jgi:hypothetical protein
MIINFDCHSCNRNKHEDIKEFQTRNPDYKVTSYKSICFYCHNRQEAIKQLEASRPPMRTLTGLRAQRGGKSWLGRWAAAAESIIGTYAKSMSKSANDAPVIDHDGLPRCNSNTPMPEVKVPRTIVRVSMKPDINWVTCPFNIKDFDEPINYGASVAEDLPIRTKSHAEMLDDLRAINDRLASEPRSFSGLTDPNIGKFGAGFKPTFVVDDSLCDSRHHDRINGMRSRMSEEYHRRQAEHAFNRARDYHCGHSHGCKCPGCEWKERVVVERTLGLAKVVADNMGVAFTEASWELLVGRVKDSMGLKV